MSNNKTFSAKIKKMGQPVHLSPTCHCAKLELQCTALCTCYPKRNCGNKNRPIAPPMKVGPLLNMAQQLIDALAALTGQMNLNQQVQTQAQQQLRRADLKNERSTKEVRGKTEEHTRVWRVSAYLIRKDGIRWRNARDGPGGASTRTRCRCGYSTSAPTLIGEQRT